LWHVTQYWASIAVDGDVAAETAGGRNGGPAVCARSEAIASSTAQVTATGRGRLKTSFIDGPLADSRGAR